ncbi:ABC transporter ATP-binding protein [Uliginosibacterium sp. H3]|uniref:ABC transporter ATP-binding protein n=1 Tax=Uliginosibacterium silvisoli TaxID=3114758 RepID=A0ABU6K581_9RHOO|nr:ABC transporter ATP-binding protein [Uliginosibacterium sp. H3]
MNAARDAFLKINDLAIDVHNNAGALQIVDKVSLEIAAGETVCLVGESGSGKSITALSVMRLIEFKNGAITRGAIRFDGRDLASLTQREMSELRGDRIGIIFQEPMTAFDPVFTIGEQIAEVIVRHKKIPRAHAMTDVIRLLDRVHIPDAALRVKQYPHELSGGMRQRAMIAMALACDPELLIADEPTTALDVTIQAQILKLLQEIQRETGLSILLITHDLGMAAEIADRVVVMYAGRIVEQASVEDLFGKPAHPYTQGLLASVVGSGEVRAKRLYSIEGSIPILSAPPSGCRFHPRCPHASAQCVSAEPALQVSAIDGKLREVACWHHTTLPALDVLSRTASTADDLTSSPASRAAGMQAARNRFGSIDFSAIARRISDPNGTKPRPPLIDVISLQKHFPIKGGWPGARKAVRAVDGVSFQIKAGETFGLVGESGCGKSTLARVLLQLEKPTQGQVIFDGDDITRLPRKELQEVRRNMQMVFQDPYGSINSRWTVGDIIGEPLAVHEHLSKAEQRSRVEELLQRVGLDPSGYDRYPHQFSGGQRQRIGIARAISLNPKFVLADEAVSALDVSVQAQVINLLQDLKEQLGLTYLFIGHGLNVVRHVSDRIGVMYLGKLVEVGPADEIFTQPAHHYTRALISAIPIADPTRRREFIPIVGEIPSPTNPPSGCRFHTRCPAATQRCRDEQPELAAVNSAHAVACHFPL